MPDKLVDDAKKYLNLDIKKSNYIDSLINIEMDDLNGDTKYESQFVLNQTFNSFEDAEEYLKGNKLDRFSANVIQGSNPGEFLIELPDTALDEPIQQEKASERIIYEAKEYLNLDIRKSTDTNIDINNLDKGKKDQSQFVLNQTFNSRDEVDKYYQENRLEELAANVIYGSHSEEFLIEFPYAELLKDEALKKYIQQEEERDKFITKENLIESSPEVAIKESIEEKGVNEFIPKENLIESPEVAPKESLEEKELDEFIPKEKLKIGSKNNVKDKKSDLASNSKNQIVQKAKKYLDLDIKVTKNPFKKDEYSLYEVFESKEEAEKFLKDSRFDKKYGFKVEFNKNTSEYSLVCSDTKFLEKKIKAQEILQSGPEYEVARDVTSSLLNNGIITRDQQQVLIPIIATKILQNDDLWDKSQGSDISGEKREAISKDLQKFIESNERDLYRATKAPDELAVKLGLKVTSGKEVKLASDLDEKKELINNEKDPFGDFAKKMGTHLTEHYDSISSISKAGEPDKQAEAGKSSDNSSPDKKLNKKERLIKSLESVKQDFNEFLDKSKKDVASGLSKASSALKKKPPTQKL